MPLTSTARQPCAAVALVFGLEFGPEVGCQRHRRAAFSYRPRLCDGPRAADRSAPHSRRPGDAFDAKHLEELSRCRAVALGVRRRDRQS